MSVQIIVDSTADLAAGLEQRVTIVPLTIHFGEKEYISGVDITTAQFYELLVKSEELPKTSQPTPAAFEDAFQEAVDAGNDVVCITLSSKLSGTYQSASIAASEFPGKVFVVDSRTVALAAGLLTGYALKLADQGLSAEQIAAAVTEKREKVRLYALVDTLEYLKKGGRVSSTVAFAGGLLNIKPMIEVADGEVRMAGKARGAKQGNALLMQAVEKSGGVDFTMPAMLGYTGVDDSGLQKFLEENGSFWSGDGKQVSTQVVGSVVGTHAGPGAVAIAYFAAE